MLPRCELRGPQDRPGHAGFLEQLLYLQVLVGRAEVRVGLDGDGRHQHHVLHPRLPGFFEDVGVRSQTRQEKQRTHPLQRGLQRRRLCEVALHDLDALGEDGPSGVTGERSQRPDTPCVQFLQQGTADISSGSGHEDHERVSRRQMIE
jgi:hypothetical protein